MARTKHFYHGCPWADGGPQCADTTQVYNWDQVTCGHCQVNRAADGTSQRWKEGDRQRFEETVKFLAKTEAPTTFVIGHDQRAKVTREQLITLGAKVDVRRRQLTRREKTYLRIRGRGGHTRFHGVLLPTIRELWPDAYMTSGSFWICRIDRSGDRQRMDMIVALEK